MIVLIYSVNHYSWIFFCFLLSWLKNALWCYLWRDILVLFQTPKSKMLSGFFPLVVMFAIEYRCKCLTRSRPFLPTPVWREVESDAALGVTECFSASAVELHDFPQYVLTVVVRAEILPCEPALGPWVKPARPWLDLALFWGLSRRFLSKNDRGLAAPASHAALSVRPRWSCGERIVVTVAHTRNVSF